MFRTQFESKLQNPVAFKGEVLPNTMFDHMEGFHIDITEGSSNNVDSIIDNFFTGSGENIKKGFKYIVKMTFNTILGSNKLGENKIYQWYIVLEYGALIRVDLMAWKYNFGSEGIIAKAKNAYCYTITKSFVDPKKLLPSQILYFVAKSMGKATIEEIKSDPKIMEYVDFLVNGFNSKQSLKSTIKNYHNRGNAIGLR